MTLPRPFPASAASRHTTGRAGLTTCIAPARVDHRDKDCRGGIQPTILLAGRLHFDHAPGSPPCCAGSGAPRSVRPDGTPAVPLAAAAPYVAFAGTIRPVDVRPAALSCCREREPVNRLSLSRERSAMSVLPTRFDTAGLVARRPSTVFDHTGAMLARVRRERSQLTAA